MNECKNCFGFVCRGRFCDDCKTRSTIDNKLKCKVCCDYKNMRFMKCDICSSCQLTHQFSKCIHCDKYETISLIHNMCEKCMNDKCCYCSEENMDTLSNFKYSWVLGHIVCKKCTSTEKKGNYICEQSHSICSSQKYKCCVCKDERTYETNCNSYKGYLDTVGTVYSLSRWEHYCPQCKEVCQNAYNEYINK